MFNPSELGAAHEFTQARVRAALQQGRRLVIVDNTNTMSWEIRPYLQLAAGRGYRTFLQEPTTPWIFNAKEGAILVSFMIFVTLLTATMN